MKAMVRIRVVGINEVFGAENFSGMSVSSGDIDNTTEPMPFQEEHRPGRAANSKALNNSMLSWRWRYYGKIFVWNDVQHAISPFC